MQIYKIDKILWQGKHMKSVKELIKESAKLIEKGWDLLSNVNMSVGPVILVYVGESAYENREYLLKTLKNNWKNGNYIEEILIPIDYDGTDAVLLENKESDDNLGEVVDSVQKVIDNCIRNRLLKTMEGVFEQKRRIFVEFVMSGEDMCDSGILYEIIKPVNTLSGLEVWKNLYMMIDQSDQENEAKARSIIEEMSREKSRFFAADGFRQIYILSNFLCDGTIISEARIDENYRAISDILLLKNNFSIREMRRNEQFELLNKNESIRTVSYKLVEKPCREITIATYKSLLTAMKNVAVSEDLHKAFNSSEFTFFDDYFNRNIEDKMPASTLLSYMAWVPGEEERLKNVGSVTTEMLDRATMGQWSEFFKIYYDDVVLKETKDEDFTKELHKYLKTKFNYKEMRECFNSDEAAGVVNRGDAMALGGPRMGLLERAALLGKNYARNLYYSKRVRPVYQSTLDRLYKQSEGFYGMIARLENVLLRSLMITNSRLYSSIEQFYDDIVKNYITEHRDEFYMLMDVDYTPEKFLDALYNFFTVMVKRIDQYRLYFEGELSERLKAFGDDYARRNEIIEGALNNKIEESRRLNLASGTGATEIFQTYLGNPKADFVKRLAGGGSNKVYDLEKSDCIENLVIYEISSLEDIFGGAQ